MTLQLPPVELLPAIIAKLDAESPGLGYFFAEELTAINQEIFEKKYRPLNGLELFVLDTAAYSPGNDTHKFEMLEHQGRMVRISDYSTSLPPVNVTAEEDRFPVHEYGNSYQYSVRELKAAQVAGRPLDRDRAFAAMRSARETHNSIIWYGDGDLYGVTNYKNSPLVSISDTLDENTLLTPDQIIAVYSQIFNSVKIRSGNAMHATRMIVPTAQYVYMHETPRTSNSDTSIAKWMLDNFARLEEIVEAQELAPDLDDPFNPLTKPQIICDSKDKEVFAYASATLFESRPPQDQNLATVVNNLADSAGMYSVRPLGHVRAELG